MKRFGHLIMKEDWAIKLSINLLYKLWKKIITAATYLYNQIFCALNNSKLLYKLFYTYIFDKKKVSEPRKLKLYLSKIYGSKAYMLIKSKNDPEYWHKLQKPDSKVHISFFVDYKSINIYQIWVPYKKNVILVRNVTFNEDET